MQGELAALKAKLALLDASSAPPPSGSVQDVDFFAPLVDVNTAALSPRVDAMAKKPSKLRSLKDMLKRKTSVPTASSASAAAPASNEQNERDEKARTIASQLERALVPDTRLSPSVSLAFVYGEPASVANAAASLDAAVQARQATERGTHNQHFKKKLFTLLVSVFFCCRNRS